MRFSKTWRPIPPKRGPGRHRYRMSPDALEQRRRNLGKYRAAGRLWRSHDETVIIRRLVWQWANDPAPKMSARGLARELGVWLRHVQALRDAAPYTNMGAGRRFTLDDLRSARMTTESLRLDHPELFATRRTRKPSASAPACLTHAPGCSCDSCVCSRCGKLSPPNSHARALSERCACVRHAENCSCAECHIARAIASGTSLGCGCT